MTTDESYVGVDLDSTLAHYDGWRGKTHIGEPIQPMVDRVKKFLAEGQKVCIFTARVATDEERTEEEAEAQRKAIQAWCKQYIGQELPVTCIKRKNIIHYFDDRASGVVPNAGQVIGPEPVIQPHPFPNGMPLK